jgi:hypothetical protein
MDIQEIEQAVIQELLAEPRWSRSGLKVRLERFAPEDVDAAFATLAIEGVCLFDGLAVQASRALRYFDMHGLLTLDPTPRNAPDSATIDRILARQPPRG